MDKKVPVVRFKGFTDDWEQVKLGKTVKREKSYPLTRSAETNDNTNYRYIHYGDIHTGRATIINQASDLPKIKQSDYLTLKSGDIIVADASEDYKGIADAALLTSTFGENIVAGLHTIAMSPINTSSLFLYYKFQTSDFKKYGRKTGTGLKVFGISSNNLLKYSFFTPSETEQERIGKLLFILEKTITLYHRHIIKLEQIRRSLHSDFFSKNTLTKQFDNSYTLGQVFNYEQPTKYIVKSTEYNDENSIPVLTAGKTFILGYTDENNNTKNATYDDPVIIFDDFTTGMHFVDFKFKVKSSALKILSVSSINDFDPYYCFNLLKSFSYNPKSHTRHWISEYENISVNIPSIKEQRKIGNIFRNIDNEISLQKKLVENAFHLKRFLLQKMFIN